MNLADYAADPLTFEENLYIKTGTGVKRLGPIMATFQRKRFVFFNRCLLALATGQKPPISRIWDERTKGGSKDSDWATCLLWLLGFSRVPLRIQVGAFDQEQADEIRLIVKDILRIDKGLNQFLRSVIQVKTTTVVNTRTNLTVAFLTHDRLGSHGARPDLLLINELTHQPSKDFASTLFDNLDKMPNSLGVVCTNAGHDPSWQLDWKRLFQSSPDRWKIFEYRQRPPWLDDTAWKEAERRNSSNRFRRLFCGEWTGDTEGALDHLDIQNAITQTQGMTGKERGWRFVAALDIGLRKHSTGLVVLGRHVGYLEEHEVEQHISDRARTLADLGLVELPPPEIKTVYEEPTNRLRLAFCMAWKPSPGKRVSLESVKAKIIELDRQFDLAAVLIDPAQGEHLIELLTKEGVNAVRCIQSVPSLQNQAVSLIEAFQQGTIDLFDHADLVADLKRLQLRERGDKVRLLSPEVGDGEAGTGHGDLASSLSFAVAGAKDTTIVLPQTRLMSIIAE